MLLVSIRHMSIPKERQYFILCKEASRRRKGHSKNSVEDSVVALPIGPLDSQPAPGSGSNYHRVDQDRERRRP